MGFFSETAYREKVEAIFTRFPSVQKVPFGDAYKPGLEHMVRFGSVLGDPHRDYRTVHVAGTNGKGSVASMLAAALSSAGLKVGLYTSPHIVDFRERARIIGPAAQASSGSLRFAPCPGKGSLEEPAAAGASVLVPEEYVYDFLCRYEDVMDELSLSFFEITTGLAFKWFSDEGVDVAVIETGLGGRLDSTNIITPDLSVVTSIALDHCALLGGTLQAIAKEKAGIFKPGVPALVGEYLPETRPVFEEAARATGSPFYFAQDLTPSVPSGEEEILKSMDLKGEYQAHNLRTVLAAVDILKEIHGYEGLCDTGRTVAAISRAAAVTGFHGRWETLCEKPRVIADIGHNPAALKENFSQLSRMLDEGESDRLIIIYAVMADKDLDGILPLMPADATWIFTAPQTARALPADDILKRYAASLKGGAPRAYTAGTVRQAVQMATRLALNLSAPAGRSADPVKPAPPLVFIGGSAFVVAEALPLFG